MKFTTLVSFASFSVSAFGAPSPGKDVSKLPPVQSDKLSQAIQAGNLAKHADAFEKLTQGDRTYASQGQNNTIEYIKKKLDATGYYTTELQTLQGIYSHGKANFAAFYSGREHKYEATFFKFSPSGHVTGDLVVPEGRGCEKGNFSTDKMNDSIVLIPDAGCNKDFGERVEWALEAGARAAIFYDKTTVIPWPSLADWKREWIPTVHITGNDIIELVEAIAQQKVTGTLAVDGVKEERYSTNLVARTRGGDPNNIVMAGAASDSVPDSPGFNDNASGAIALLEIALKLSEYSVKSAVSFAWWTMEQIEEYGSYTYAATLPETELSKIAVYLNLKAIASPNYGVFTTSGCDEGEGESKMRNLLTGYYKTFGVESEPAPKDYLFGGAFQERNIPSGGIFSGGPDIKSPHQATLWGGHAGAAFDPNVQGAGDDRANLNEDAWVLNTKVVAHFIATLSNDVSKVPRNVTWCNNNQKRELSLDRNSSKRRFTGV